MKELVKKGNILGAKICAISLSDAVSKIEEFIRTRGLRYICVCNVHTVMICFDNPEFRRITNEAALTVPDGMPLVWVLRLLGFEQKGRVYGPDLMWTLCERSVNAGYSHFLYGGSNEVLSRLEETLVQNLSGIKIAGSYSPPYRPLSQQEDEDVIKMINGSGADILWVGLGAPKQEIWMATHLGRIKIPVMIGVGAAFDFHAGAVRQAPKFMQDKGTEWLFRLIVEPRRLWKRYLYNNPRFVYYIGRQILSQYLRNALATTK
jgi:N-acetylglucosaminyldiphosphoundecaprenol N-acetyl-beta-D-mannosaminyltransferase